METMLTEARKGFEKGYVNLKTICRKHNMLKEAAVENGEKLENVLKEAMVSSDFAAMADILDRMMLAEYKEPSDKPQFDLTRLCSVKRVRDFRDIKVYQQDEIDNLEEVKEKEDYKMKPVEDTLIKQYAIKKWGRLFGCSFEAWVNQDLDEVRNVPKKLARASRRRRIANISALYNNNNVFFTVARGNFGTGVLNEANFETGIRAMLRQTDNNGNPIDGNYPAFLVTPAALTHQGQRMVKQFEQIIYAVTRATMPLNYLIEHIIDPRLDATSATQWFLFASPNDGVAIQMLQLVGHETPELFIKDVDAVRINETGVLGGKNAYDGSFDNDDIEMKGRDFHNEALIDYRMAYRSNGTV